LNLILLTKKSCCKTVLQQLFAFFASELCLFFVLII